MIVHDESVALIIVGERDASNTYCARGVFIVVFVFVLFARVIIVALIARSVAAILVIVSGDLLVILIIVQQGLTLDQVAETHRG
jgi:hypothetical protein